MAAVSSSFVLLVCYSGAVDREHSTMLGALLITSTVVLVVFVVRSLVEDVKKHAMQDEREEVPSDDIGVVVRSLAEDVKKHAMQDERELSSDDIGVEMGALSSVAEDAQAKSNEETSGELTATSKETPQYNLPDRADTASSTSASPWLSILSIGSSTLCAAETADSTPTTLTETGQTSFDELASLAIAAGVDRSEVSRLALAHSKQLSPPVTRDEI